MTQPQNQWGWGPAWRQLRDDVDQLRREVNALKQKPVEDWHGKATRPSPTA